MTQTFTQDDLIRYLYHETTEKENLEINKALLCDSELQKQYKELILVKTQLDATHIEPSETSVNNILSYTRSLQEKN